MKTQRHYYNDKKEITCDEAHGLVDKSGLMTSDKEIKFKKEKNKDGNK